MSVLDVKGGSIRVKGWEHTLPFSGPALNRFDDDALMLPGIVIEDVEASLKNHLLPLFDMIWQAAGFSDCFMRSAKDLEW